MTFSLKQVIIVSAITAIIGAGVESKYASNQVSKDASKETTKNNIATVIRVIKQPNGAEETITTIVDHTVTKETTTKSISTPIPQKKINVSALVANDFSRGVLQPVYGVSASKEFIGPITLGAFGLTNGTIGLSVGVNF